jgi:hypothetical protein
MVANFAACKKSYLALIKNYQKGHDQVQNVVEVEFFILLDQQEVHNKQTEH